MRPGRWKLWMTGSAAMVALLAVGWRLVGPGPPTPSAMTKANAEPDDGSVLPLPAVFAATEEEPVSRADLGVDREPEPVDDTGIATASPDDDVVASFAGVVVSREGDPSPSAEVYARRVETGQAFGAALGGTRHHIPPAKLRTKCDAEGRFRLVGGQPGATYEFFVASSNCITTESARPVQAASAPALGLTLVLSEVKLVVRVVASAALLASDATNDPDYHLRVTHASERGMHVRGQEENPERRHEFFVDAGSQVVVTATGRRLHASPAEVNIPLDVDEWVVDLPIRTVGEATTRATVELEARDESGALAQGLTPLVSRDPPARAPFANGGGVKFTFGPEGAVHRHTMRENDRGIYVLEIMEMGSYEIEVGQNVARRHDRGEPDIFVLPESLWFDVNGSEPITLRLSLRQGGSLRLRVPHAWKRHQISVVDALGVRCSGEFVERETSRADHRVLAYDQALPAGTYRVVDAESRSQRVAVLIAGRRTEVTFD